MKPLLLLVAAASGILAQTAQITGLVTDSSNAAILGAELSVTNAETGVSRKTVANEQGNYAVPLLQPGIYSVTVQSQGFRSVSQTNIRLEVDQVLRIDFTLEVGTTTESITVTDTPPLLQTSSGSLGQVIESKQFTDMALNDRGALGLLALSDGVMPSRQFNAGSFSNANIFSANGSRPGQNEILLDGAPNTLPGVWPGRGILGTPVQVDAVREFKVQTSVFSAEYGRTGGGLINMVGRSGTNEMHGSLFHFLRNSALDANDFFNNRSGVPLGAFRRNQFGGTLGGPLVVPKFYNGRNRTFFFFNYQGTRAAEARQRIVSTPTAAMKSGDFSGLRTAGGAPIIIYDPLTTTQVGSNPIRTPFPGNRIPPDRINPVGAALASYFPSPNLPGNVNNLSQAGAFRQINDLLGIRVDHRLSDAHQLFVRYNRTFDDGQNPRWLDTAAQGFTSLVQNVNAVAADYTWTATASTLVNLRYGYTDRSHDNIDPSIGMDLTSLRLPSYVNQAAQIRVFPRVASTGYLTLGNDQGRNDFSYRNHSAQASATKVMATHTMKFGADVRANFVDQRRGIEPSGSFNFTRNFTQGPNANVGGATVGDGIASMLLGTPASGVFGTAVRAVSWNEYFAFYFQDDWKVNRRLTLNLGVRYDLEMPRYETSNMLDWFDYDARSPLNDRVRSLGEIRGGLQFAGVNGNPRRHFNTDRNNFAPRGHLLRRGKRRRGRIQHRFAGLRTLHAVRWSAGRPSADQHAVQPVPGRLRDRRRIVGRSAVAGGTFDSAPLRPHGAPAVQPAMELQRPAAGFRHRVAGGVRREPRHPSRRRRWFRDQPVAGGDAGARDRAAAACSQSVLRRDRGAGRPPQPDDHPRPASAAVSALPESDGVQPGRGGFHIPRALAESRAPVQQRPGLPHLVDYGEEHQRCARDCRPRRRSPGRSQPPRRPVAGGRGHLAALCGQRQLRASVRQRQAHRFAVERSHGSESGRLAGKRHLHEAGRVPSGYRDLAEYLERARRPPAAQRDRHIGRHIGPRAGPAR
jgi:hypothetical protein